MNSNLLSYPSSINFETGKIGNQSSPINWTLIGFTLLITVCCIILISSKKEDENIIELIED
jgi:hypothetical protein